MNKRKRRFRRYMALIDLDAVDARLADCGYKVTPALMRQALAWIGMNIGKAIDNAIEDLPAEFRGEFKGDWVPLPKEKKTLSPIDKLFKETEKKRKQRERESK